MCGSIVIQQLEIEDDSIKWSSSWPTDLVLKQHKEAECKGNDEEEKHREELHKGVADVCEHHHIDAKHGELADEEHKINPSQEYGDCGQLPLPVL